MGFIVFNMKKIIHVDNSEFFRKMMGSFLEAEGFEVEGFESAQEANLSIGAGNADMVIMGLAFSGIEGEDFLRKTTEAFSGPVIIVSSSAEGERIETLIDLGAKAVISKAGPWKEKLGSHLAALKEV